MDQFMAAVAKIRTERGRQQTKWADQHTWGKGDCSSLAVAPLVKLAVLLEEVGEVARAILEHDGPDRVRAELVQVAAVAIAWLETPA